MTVYSLMKAQADLLVIGCLFGLGCLANDSSAVEAQRPAAAALERWRSLQDARSRGVSATLRWLLESPETGVRRLLEPWRVERQGHEEGWAELPACRVPDQPIHTGTCVEPPRPRFSPWWPLDEGDVEGVVIVQVLVGRSGHVEDARILRGLSAAQNQAVLDRLRGSSYQPALRCGRPVSVWINTTANFQRRAGIAPLLAWVQTVPERVWRLRWPEPIPFLITADRFPE